MSNHDLLLLSHAPAVLKCRLRRPKVVLPKASSFLHSAGRQRGAECIHSAHCHTQHKMKLILLFSAVLVPMLWPFVVSAKPKYKPSQVKQYRHGSKTIVNVKDFKPARDGRNDDTAAFAAALAKLEQTNGGILLIPNGTYIVGDLRVRSGISLIGAGPPPFPVLLKAPRARTILDISSPMVSAQRPVLHDVTIQNLILRGRSAEQGFSEHIHNVSVVGITRLLVTHVRFEAFQGDGLYIGSRLQSSEHVSHNSQVEVVDSTFDGSNYENRNGVSIIDCSHCRVEHCEFVNLSRADMPGGIDLEPDWSDEILSDVALRNNVIKSGGAAGISIVITRSEFDTPPSEMLVEGNQIQNTRTGVLVQWRTAPPSGGSAPQAIIRSNSVTNAQRALVLDGTAGFLVENNELLGSRRAVQLGLHFGISNLHFAGNRLSDIGNDSGHGIVVFGPIEKSVFDGNIFIDLGSTQGDGSAIYFARGSVNGVSFTGNTFSSPSHRTKTATASAFTTRLTSRNNLWKGNVLNDGISSGVLSR